MKAKFMIGGVLLSVALSALAVALQLRQHGPFDSYEQTPATVLDTSITNYEMDLLRTFIYSLQAAFEAPFVGQLSRDRRKLIIRVPTQESLLPSDFNKRKVALLVVADLCKVRFPPYFPFSAFDKDTRIEFIHNDADKMPTDPKLGADERLKRMTLGVYENGELTIR
jgi:hypothetical protein